MNDRLKLSGAGRQGTLFGVGVGPGDPGLVTFKAVEVIQNVPVVAFPVHRQGASSRALETVRKYLSDSSMLLPLLMPMTKDQGRLRRAHEAAAKQLTKAGADGQDIAYLALGDPMFYSTFGYLAQRYPGLVQVVSGVSAVSATAAAVGLPLAVGDTPTVVVTGVDYKGLKAALEMEASVVIIKPRALSSASLDLLDKHGAWKRACAAIELGGSQHGRRQQILGKLDRTAAEKLPYFAVIWIKPNG